MTASTEKKKWQNAVLKKEIPSVHDLPKKKPLELGLWCLYVSKHDFNTEYLSYEEIENILTEYLDVPMKVAKLKKAFAPAVGTKIIKKENASVCKISAAGEVYLKSLKKGGNLNVVYVNPDRPREATKNLEELVESISKDELLICDPYYGINTLDVLEVFAKSHKKIKFLTAKLGGSDKSTTVTAAVTAFKKQYGSKVEMRLASASDFHDRYIIARDRFLMIGQGLKDLGNKESLIVVIPDQIGKDTRKTLVTNFNTRWSSATSL